MFKIIYFICSLVSFNFAFAAEGQKLSLLEITYRQANYNKIIEIIEFDLETYKKNPVEYEFLALAYEANSRFDDASKIYKYILNTFYRDEIKKLKENNKVNTEKLEGFSPEFVHFYQKIAYDFSKVYQTMNDLDSEKRLEQIRQLVLDLQKTSEKLDGQGALVTNINTIIEEKSEYFAKRKYSTHYYPYLSILSWQDNVSFDGNQGSFKTVSTYSTSCSGLGLSRSNAIKKYFIDICSISGSATASSLTTSVQYQKAKIPVSGFLLNTGILFSSSFKYISYGPVLHMLNKKSVHEKPNDQYEIVGDEATRLGFGAEFRWDYWKLFTSIRYSRIFGNKSSTYQVLTAWQ